MCAIDEIVRRLQRYPHVESVRTCDSISIAPASPEGFVVGLVERGGTFTVSFAGWHETFDAAAEALNCVAFGLSDDCRLRVATRGGVDYRWTVESLENGSWRDDSSTGLLVFPFWARKHERVLQNRVLEHGRTAPG